MPSFFSLLYGLFVLPFLNPESPWKSASLASGGEGEGDDGGNFDPDG